MLPPRFKVFLFEPSVGFVVILAGAVQLIMWWLVFQARSTVETLILHYTTEFGVDYVGPWSSTLAIPVVGLIFLCVDIVLAFLVYARYRLFAYVLLWAALFVQLILAVASVLIIFLNS